MPAKIAAAVVRRVASSVLAAVCVLAAAAPARAHQPEPGKLGQPLAGGPHARTHQLAAASSTATYRGLTPVRAHQLEPWTLADPPLFEVGRGGGDGVLFEYVGGAAVMADGSVLVADRGPRQILRLSPAGEVIEVYGGAGQGPGEFRWLQHVFAEGDTILAYDSGARRVTAWRPGAAEPDVRSLPQVNGMPTSLRAMASSTAWLVELNAYPAPDERAGLKERRREFFSFDADADVATSMGTRHVGYDFVHHVEGGNMANSVPFLGTARVVGVGSQWLFAPMDDAALELWSPGGGSPARRIPLPVERVSYNRDAIQALRVQEISGVPPEDAALLRAQFDGVLADLPPLTPPVAQLVKMGGDVWVQPFSSDLNGAAEWLVVDPVAGIARAAATVDPELTLLAGSDDVAVLLGRTQDLEEQFVQVRRIVRGSGGP